MKTKKDNTIKRLLSYMLKDYKLRMLGVVIFIIISTCATVASSLFLETLIDDYIAPLLLSSDPVFTGLFKALIYMGLIYAVGILSTLFYNRSMVTVSQGILKSIRNQMFGHMQSLPIKYFDTHSHGDIMSFYTNDVDTLRQMLSQSVPQFFSSVVTVVAIFFVMIFTNIPLTFVVILCLSVMLLITKKIAGKSGQYFSSQQESMGKINGYIEEMVGGQKVVKVFCHEDAAKREFDLLNDELFYNSDAANKYANILMPIIGNLGNLQYALLAIVGGGMMFYGMNVSMGVIVAFLQLSRNFTMPISQISQQLNSIVMALAGAKRIFSLIDEEEEQDDGDVTLVNVLWAGEELEEAEEHTGLWAWKQPHLNDGSVTYTPLAGDVRFFDMDFEYEKGKPVLCNISLFAEAGQKVAFVGATGAGKTTITNLINRFYDVSEGKIRYDGININKIKKSDLRRSLGIVLQDTNLFTGTVRENIRYGRLDATDEEVESAARLANAHGFIERLPKGYDTELTSNGADLSQGQRQLLSIARAAVADPPVMILDEATSSIDTRTENIVQCGMDSLMKGRTVFVIAHRLSTVQNSDVIMVMEHGRIAERGNHGQLIEERGIYYQLYSGAFELE